MSKRLGMRIATAALLGLVPASAVAEALILRSIGPSRARYPVGTRVPDNATFTLRPGDAVAILTRQGTRVFSGPGTFGANRADPGPRRTTARVRIDIGATRGSPDMGAPNSIWSASVYGGGAICYPGGQRPTLWRGNAGQAIPLTITSPFGRAHNRLWSAGDATLSWPSAVPIDPAATYGLRLGDLAEIRVQLRPIANARSLGKEALAHALLAARCDDQLATFVALNLAPSP